MMQGDLKHGMQCVQFEALLIDALDGAMTGTELEQFRAHAQACTDCGPLFEHAQEGMKLLRSLPELEPPVQLVHNILAATSQADAHARVPAVPAMKQSWWQRTAEWLAPGSAQSFEHGRRVIMQPRVAMTAAMAFFSLSVMINLAGVNLKDLRHMDLRPSAISSTAQLQYHETTAKVVKYYENIRFVYELESRLNELKKSATSNTDQKPAEEAPQQQKPADDNSTKNPRDQNQNYSFEVNSVTMAQLDKPPALGNQCTGIRRIS
jgi:hypothetical protein